MDPWNPYPQAPPPPKPANRGLIITLIAVIAVAAVVAAGALVFMVIGRSDQADPTSSPTRRTPTTSPTQTTPSPTPDPTEPTRESWELAVDMLGRLDNQENLAIGCHMQFDADFGETSTVFYATLDGLMIRGSFYSYDELHSDWLTEIVGTDMVSTTVWHYDETWSQESFPVDECLAEGSYCTTPGAMTASLMGVIGELGTAIINQEVVGVSDLYDGEPVMLFTLEYGDLPGLLTFMGATQATLWISSDTYLPMRLDTVLNLDELDQAQYLDVDG